MSSQPTNPENVSISESNIPPPVPISRKTTIIQNLINSSINFIEPHPNVLKRKRTQPKRKKIPFIMTVSLNSLNSPYDDEKDDVVVREGGNDLLESGGDEERSDVSINGN
ncbi:15609_t:CDS:1 [Funneliformis geosporum]|uniref:226_t:CDS:1 n=1 Tax=Funneliformis geosporum TaxID=1117311 RepID=A0A9W4SPJ2_9GLOM|nr:15609_t:CDS:1 [Funneliformis geosporum]CAI2176868.1 226_t:CDS:1 [Funneliformis geosporum]